VSVHACALVKPSVEVQEAFRVVGGGVRILGNELVGVNGRRARAICREGSENEREDERKISQMNGNGHDGGRRRR